jgi:O-methyltransferase
MDINKLIESNRIISDQIDKRSLKVVLENLSKTLEKDVPGDVVELGCYKGTTSLFIRRVLDYYKSDKKFYVYDSFEGLPWKSSDDQSIIGEVFKEGELKATKKELINNFKKAGLTLPIIHKGWFKDIKHQDMPKNISFAFLDGDFFESIFVSLELVYHFLSDGGIIVVDDYDNPKLPGVEKAVDTFFIDLDVNIQKIANEAVIYF